jgi:hypothetical protein
MQQQQNKKNTETKWQNHRQILFFKILWMKITQKKFDIKYTHVIQGSYNKEYKKTFVHIMSHF